MTDIKTIQKQIQTRLAEVEALIEPLRLELEQLTKMAASFGGKSDVAARPAALPASAPARRRAPRKTAPKSAAAPTGAKRGRPPGSGNRAQQAVAKITEQPGITASELAKSMGISPNYLYRVLPRLEKEAKVTKQGRGYHPISTSDTAARANGQPVAA